MRISFTSLVSVAALCLYSLDAFSGVPSQYQVSPLYAPPLQRPSLTISPDSLPQGVSGRLPRFDGDAFILTCEGGDTTYNADSMKAFAGRILTALKSPPSSAPLQIPSLKPPSQPDTASLNQFISQRLTLADSLLRGEFGALSPGVSSSIATSGREYQDYVTRRRRVARYTQMSGKFPIETAGVMVRWVQGKGVTSIQGQVFKTINITNAITPHLNYDSLITAYVLSQSHNRPLRITLQHIVILPYGSEMRYAMRVIVELQDGPYCFHVDAANGVSLTIRPMFYNVDAIGNVLYPMREPGALFSSGEMTFKVDNPGLVSTAFYLKVSEPSSITTKNEKPPPTMSVRVSPSSDIADFTLPIPSDLSPNSPDENFFKFPEVNAFAWGYNFITSKSSIKFPDITIRINLSGSIQNNSLYNKNSHEVKFGVGGLTVNPNSTSTTEYLNVALDPALVLHELGHALNCVLLSNPSTLPTQPEDRNVWGATQEGLADFWASSALNEPLIGALIAANQHEARQDGFLPREADPLDVFPWHRRLGADAAHDGRDLSDVFHDVHSDGQILSWALWSARAGMNEMYPAIGGSYLEAALIEALKSDFDRDLNPSDISVHNSFQNILANLNIELRNSPCQYKVLSGFARAGIFEEDRVAIIDINRDFIPDWDLQGPTFTVWTGRDYRFMDMEAVRSKRFNPYYEIEVANDPGLKENLYSSGVLRFECWFQRYFGGSYIKPVAEWKLPESAWNQLKRGDRIYYRVSTRGCFGSHFKSSVRNHVVPWAEIVHPGQQN